MKYLPNHLTVAEYAKQKDRSRTVIYKYITEGKITPDKVGKNENLMIDWTIYGSLVIPQGNNNKKNSLCGPKRNNPKQHLIR